MFIRIWECPKIRVPYFGVLIIRILLGTWGIRIASRLRRHVGWSTEFGYVRFGVPDVCK